MTKASSVRQHVIRLCYRRLYAAQRSLFPHRVWSVLDMQEKLTDDAILRIVELAAKHSTAALAVA